MRIVNPTPFKLEMVSTEVPAQGRASTIVLKGTFELRNGAACVPAGEQDQIADDKSHLDDLGRSLAWAGDRAPLKPRSDFYILGTFHQPGGIAAPAGEAAFQFGPLAKRLAFHGPRLAQRRPDGGWWVGPAAPVRSVPLRWELSFGGLDDPRNPMGLGLDPVRLPDGAEAVPLPQIEDPDALLRSPQDRSRPANFAPVPPSFQERLRKRGTYDRRWQVFRSPLPPVDFDPSLYNAAPEDQQAGNFPRGDETLMLRNLHPSIPELTTRLPGLQPRIGVLRPGGAEPVAEEVAMNLDTVVALPDQDRLVLIWRSAAPLPDRSGLDWLELRMEALDGAPEPFAAMAQRMLQAYKAAQPKREAPAAAAAEADAGEDLEAATAETLAETRKLLATVELPPAVRQAVDTETDPEALYDVLDKHLDEILADLQRQYPTA